MKTLEIKLISFSALILLVLISAGCANEIPLTHVSGVVDYSGINLTKYASMGFLYTPYTYNYEYESVGLLSVTTMPEANLVPLTEKEIEENLRILKEYYPKRYQLLQDGGGINKWAWKINVLNVNYALDSLYVKARDLGADAVVSLEITNLTESYTSIIDDVYYPVTIKGFKISGFAIKRHPTK